MTAVAQEVGAILLVTRESPTAEALDDDIYLTLPVVAPAGIGPATVDVFLTVEFARSDCRA
jgi:hypothetical protein